MTDRSLEEIRRHLRAPVAPRDAFARSLLERLEGELAGTALSDDELDAQSGEELPLREAMSLIVPDPLGAPDPAVIVCDPPEPLPPESLPPEPLPPESDQTA